MKKLLLYTEPCEVEMALLAINANSSVWLRWRFPGWHLSGWHWFRWL